MSHPYPVTSIKYCVNVSNKINFARYQRTARESKISYPMKAFGTLNITFK